LPSHGTQQYDRIAMIEYRLIQDNRLPRQIFRRLYVEKGSRFEALEEHVFGDNDLRQILFRMNGDIKRKSTLPMLKPIRGLVRFALSDFQGAIDDIGSHSPQNETERWVMISLLPYLGYAHFRLGHIGKSNDIFKKAEKLKPQDPTIYILLAQRAIDRGKQEEAQIEISKACAITRNSPEVNFMQGQIALERGEEEIARQYLSLAAKRGHESAISALQELDSSSKQKTRKPLRVTKERYPEIASMYVQALIRLGTTKPTQVQLENETPVSQTKWSYLLRDHNFLDAITDAISKTTQMLEKASEPVFHMIRDIERDPSSLRKKSKAKIDSERAEPREVSSPSPETGVDDAAVDIMSRAELIQEALNMKLRSVTRKSVSKLTDEVLRDILRGRSR
jgi:tetratricopeptide (TPR) repeat protein